MLSCILTITGLIIIQQCNTIGDKDNLSCLGLFN